MVSLSSESFISPASTSESHLSACQNYGVTIVSVTTIHTISTTSTISTISTLSAISIIATILVVAIIITILSGNYSQKLYHIGHASSSL